MRIAICDDDLNFAGELETLILQESKHMGQQVETEVFSDGKMLVESIWSGDNYDIIFIDIEMGQVDGITAARRIREMERSSLLIYISGYENYLKELFEVEPFRFLSKPLDVGMFCRYFREACQRIDNSAIFYEFAFNKETQKVPLKDVVYFESRNRVIYIYMKDGSSCYFYGKLNNVEKELTKSQYFLRIHQSYMINYNYAKRITFTNVELSFAGRDIKLKISDDRQKAIRRRLLDLAVGKAAIK
ncbi:MAG: response regulator transcription factor [Acetatifactor sp.]|nr:response regulator transcription factor [Acetatifactor sp.]